MAAEMAAEVSSPDREQSSSMGQQLPTWAGGFMPVSLGRLFLLPPRYNPRDSSSQSLVSLCSFLLLSVLFLRNSHCMSGVQGSISH